MESKRKKGHTVDSRSLGQSSITGCDSTTKQTCFLKRCFFGDGNYRVFGYDGILGKGRASHLIISSLFYRGVFPGRRCTYKVLDVLSFALESGGSIWHLSIPLSSPDCHQLQRHVKVLIEGHTLLAKIRFSTLTEFTFLTLGGIEWDNVISNFNVRYTLTD